MTRLSTRLLAPALVAALLLVPAVAQAGPALPKTTGPALNATFTTMPVLTWNKAPRAVSYEVQIASDSGFNPALVDATTANLRFLYPKMLSNGAYYWRVRSLDAQSAASKWTKVRKFTKKWTTTATLSTPGNLSTISYPDPAILRWSQVPGASTYLVSVATGASGGGVDAPGGTISNGALAWSSGGQPISTSNTNLAVSTALHPGTYYWQVTPVDAEGHAGTPSQIFSFVWNWAGTTTTSVSDMVAAAEIYDPLFAWAPIPGAASYQMEVNPTADFATGSRKLLASTNATSYAPLGTLPDNTYFWRVRGVDPQGQAGPWNNGPAFTKAWDRTTPPGPANLTVYDTKLQPIAPGGHVNEPVITWSTVPGARDYELQLNCDGTPHSYFTANTAWTPLASDGNLAVPQVFSAPGTSFEQDNPPLLTGADCFASVRAYADNASDGTTQAGPFATVEFIVGTEPGFSNLPADCGSSACAGRLSPSSDVLQPTSGTTVGKSPLICWKPADMDSTGGSTTPSAAYWVSIARDPNFATTVESAYTSEPCWAPSAPLLDEATSYYWQVVPVGAGGAHNWSNAAALSGGFTTSPTFQQASVPPAPISPVGGASASGPVVFHWGVVPEQVKNYTIEVAQDPSFSTVLESATTDATSYSATTTYPVGATEYWHVRANNDNGQGLAWSATSSFVQTLPVPAITTADAFSGETFPALTWTPVSGAVGYDVQNVWPDASVHVSQNVPSTALSYSSMTGTGHGTVQVRADFPGGFTSAYTATRDVVHTIGEPQGAHTLLNKKSGALTLAWTAKPNTKQYEIQVSRSTDFVTPSLQDTTDQSAYTPSLTQQDFLDGGLLYWRVAAIDPDGNVGGFTRPVKLTLLARMSVAVSGTPAHGTRGTLVVAVTTAKGKPIKGALVHIKGAGVKPKSRRTNKKGIVSWSIQPPSIGAITVTAAKKAYRNGVTSAAVS